MTHASIPMPGQHLPAPVPGRVLRSPIGLSHAVTALLGVVIVADLLIVTASLNMRALMGRMASGNTVALDEGELSRADYAMAGSVVLYGVALLATAVVFIVWFHRLRQNAEIFAPGALSRSPGWAIACWFIPIANLWIPRGIAADILWAAQPEPRSRVPRHRGLLNAWWGAWVWALVFDRFASRAYDAAQGVDAVRDAAGLVAASAGFDMLAAVLAILFVRRLTAAQHEKALAGPAAPGR
ncbi:DUF4328 domain-containing protein [Streptomyces parvulus]|uniref:DUF4328 domain-containing protein n=1 Tax=Streptomyces TaxID=1883 RepID=UPI00280AF309|nr:DUF4328 domain-containing protein [Streptomyces sp. VNUA74]WML83880.1 DUF4328 domain-containing protein [Streptomyces sp. VNUA74]